VGSRGDPDDPATAWRAAEAIGWRQRGPRVVAIKQIDLELGKAPAANASG
jgi:hypothetical protein